MKVRYLLIITAISTIMLGVMIMGNITKIYNKGDITYQKEEKKL